MRNVDWIIFHWLNRYAGDHSWLDRPAEFAATQLALVIVGTLVVGWLFIAFANVWGGRVLPRGLLTVALVIGGSVMIGLASNSLIAHVWYRQRPFAGHSGVHLLTSHSADPSFPSDHATAAFAISFGAAAKLPRLAAVLLSETLLLSLGRVFVGLHYPGDIAGSFAVAALASATTWWVLGRAGYVTGRVVGSFNSYAAHRGWRLRIG
jgi:undecaprenyl-diphosphatase